MSEFKAASYLCPVSVQWLKPTQQSIEALRIFPFLDDDGIINGLKAELSAYLAATEDVVINTYRRAQGTMVLHNHKDQLPHWTSAVKKDAAGAAILGCSRKGILYSQVLIQQSTRARLCRLSASNCDDPITSDD